MKKNKEQEKTDLQSVELHECESDNEQLNNLNDASL